LQGYRPGSVITAVIPLEDTMRTFLIAILLLASGSPVIAQDSALPESLVEWLNVIDTEGYRTLAATDQNGFYFAVLLGEQGEFIFSSFPHETNKTRSFTTIVETVDGTNLQDLKSPPPLPPAIKRKSKDGTGFYGSIGFPVRLREHNETKLRVRYVEELDNKPDRELYNQVIVLPLKPKR
jgi:hypothetical protein